MESGAITSAIARPYPGSRPFKRADSDRFFGRRYEAVALAERWRTNSLTIVVGPTGSGKTSLVQAGLLPLVEDGSVEVLSPGRLSYGSTFPSAGLPEHNPYTLALLASWSPTESMSRLVGLSVQDYLRQRAERHSGAILAVIDQSEELLADSGPRRWHGRRLLSELATTLENDSRLHLLLCVRSSDVGQFSGVLRRGAQYPLGPLSFDGAVEAVTGPPSVDGLSFSSDAAGELVMNLLTDCERSGGGEYVEPLLLQLACVKLWESLPPGLGLVTKRDMRRHADVDAALRAYCDRIIATVADEHDISAARLRSWLINNFITDLDGRGTVYEGRTVTAGMPNNLARILEDRYLLTSESRSGSRWYALFSDRLMEPLQHPADGRTASVDPAEELEHAARALALGELDLAERYAKETLRACLPVDLRVRAETQSLLGNLAMERGKPADAEIHYRNAAGLFETTRDTASVARQLAAVGRTLRDQERLTEAVEELQAAVSRLRNDLVLQTELGWALWQFGQARAAESIFTGVLALDGGNSEALRGRGEILAELGDARGALRDLDRLTQSDLPSVHASRALALACLGEQAEAAEEIKAALIDTPRNGPALLYAAQAEAIGGDERAAVDLAERAINATDPFLTPYQREAAKQVIARAGFESGR